MDEIKKAIKKNWKELLKFFVCLFVGMVGAYFLAVSYGEFAYVEYNNLSTCTYKVSSIANYGLDTGQNTFGFSATSFNVYDSSLVNYTSNLDCNFSNSEINSGIAKLYTDNQGKFDEVAANSKLVNDLNDYMSRLTTNYYTDSKNFEYYKNDLAKLVGQDNVIEAENNSDLLLIAYGHMLQISDMNDSLMLGLKNSLITPELTKKIDTLERHTSNKNWLVYLINDILVIFICIILAVLLFVLSNHLPKYKRYFRYVAYGVVFLIVLGTIFDIVNNIISFYPFI